MKNQKHKGVREMAVRWTPGAQVATIEIRCARNGMWTINSDPCQDDLTAMRLVAECMESLAHTRDRNKRIVTSIVEGD